MSKQAAQAHWYERRQIMLGAWNGNDEGDFEAPSMVRKRQIRSDRLREKSGREREENLQFDEVM